MRWKRLLLQNVRHGRKCHPRNAGINIARTRVHFWSRLRKVPGFVCRPTEVRKLFPSPLPEFQVRKIVFEPKTRGPCRGDYDSADRCCVTPATRLCSARSCRFNWARAISSLSMAAFSALRRWPCWLGLICCHFSLRACNFRAWIRSRRWSSCSRFRQ